MFGVQYKFNFKKIMTLKQKSQSVLVFKNNKFARHLKTSVAEFLEPEQEQKLTRLQRSKY